MPVLPLIVKDKRDLVKWAKLKAAELEKNLYGARRAGNKPTSNEEHMAGAIWAYRQMAEDLEFVEFVEVKR